jgi:simple sugar transport system ATP-binding protein
MEKKLVEMINIHKWFGSVHALAGVDFCVGYNEIVGLVGDNGAGKSTLVKVLTGYHKQDQGEIYFEGVKVNFASPAEARKVGIEAVYQDQALAPDMSISRNIFMGKEPTRFLGFLDRGKMNAESMRALSKIGLNLRSPNILVGTLSGGQKQGIALARVLYFRAKLVILDEPTAALSIKEATQVLEFVENLKKEGISVIFITHNLYHVFSIADRFVVLSHGKKIGDIEKKSTSIEELSEMIVSS